MTALERLRISDAVLLLDLDGFKEVNDRHGRAAGDAVLADLGWLLRASMRGIDAVARCGGEEFLVVISQAPSAAREITDRLLADWRAGAPCSTLCVMSRRDSARPAGHRADGAVVDTGDKRYAWTKQG